MNDPAHKLARYWLAHDLESPLGPLPLRRHYESHISFVFLSDDRAFKVRKALDLGFLDYSTPQKRREATASEYAIGSRVSPSLYLGIWSLSDDDPPRLLAPSPSTQAKASRQTADGRAERGTTPTSQRIGPPHLLDDGGLGEPVLVMRRLPQELCAATLFAEQQVPPQRLGPAMEECARFHEEAPCDLSPEGWGALDKTREAWDVNFEQLPTEAPLLPFSPSERQHLIEQTQRWFQQLTPLLQQRITAGRIREGHGDLRLEHIYLTDPWSVIDPLEFSTSLRFCDVAAEVAFLAMELDACNRPDVARFALEHYARVAPDPTLLAVAPFFLRYRAVVRAKIEWLRATQLQGEPQEEHARQARIFAQLALSYKLDPTL